MKRKLTSLLLSMVMILALLPINAAAAATILSGAYCQVSEPQAGKPLPTDVKLRALSYAATLKNASITNYTWDGPLDANGNAIAGNTYTITITIEVNADSEAKFSTKSINANGSQRVRVNAKGGNLISVTQKKLVYSYSFDLGSDGKAVDHKAIEEAAKDHAAEVASRWSLAEASKVENYPLGYPITLVVNEETLKDTNYYVLDIASHPYSNYDTEIYAQFDEPGDIFHTLDGETIKTDRNSYEYQSHRITRVVYDLYREDDPSLDQFPNCTELWLSPKCDIDGILRTLGKITLQTQFVGDFYKESCTVFIPDTLYPNGPTYTDGNRPACRVMLYSGDDVYAAAKLGKEHAREWCTNHSYTRAYISDDRMYTLPTCSTDARFYYTCSKCGKVERNPKHTFYPTSGSYDNGEDGGKNTDHDFVNKVVTDEHYLGLNANGDRVYLYTCSVCGKDWIQAADAAEKKFWTADGAHRKYALGATVGKDSHYGSYAISNSDYISAKQHGWATGEVLAASEAGLIDKAVMGSDYTSSINRLQFCSVAVRLAEKMAGKTIAPAPSGTFTDTDNEYVRKAAAAGITSGVGDGRFDPNGTLTRQQMAAFLYRALQWVKNNSDVEYTVYESRLGSYTDAGELAGWARESMAFMNALGLISGTSGTTLSPNNACTIEQAIAVASRSLYADRTGWYQMNSSGDDWLIYGTRVWVYYKNGEACYRNPHGFELTGVTFGKGLRPIKDR